MSRGNLLGKNYPGGNCLGVNCPTEGSRRGNCPGENRMKGSFPVTGQGFLSVLPSGCMEDQNVGIHENIPQIKK